MSLSILFVDDDNNLTEGIGRLLTIERSDINFDIASSGEEALKFLESNRYDIIISDQKMGGITGLTLLSIAHTKYPDMKRIMLSAQVNENIFKEAEGLAHKYISKPCDFEIIISAIDEVVK